MEYRSRKLCSYGLNCRFLRNGDRCRYDHPDWQREQVQKERNSGQSVTTQPENNPFGQTVRPAALQQYPNDPTTYSTGGLNLRQNTNQTNRYSRSQNQHRTNNNQYHYQNSHNHRYQRPQQYDQYRCCQRQTQNSDRHRSRDLMNSNTLDRHQQANRNSDYNTQNYYRRDFQRRDRRSPQYEVRSYNNQNNRQYDNRNPEVKPEKNDREIKMNFNKEVRKIQEQPQSYQPSQSLKDRIHELFQQDTQEIDLQGLRQAALQAQTLRHQRELRRVRQLRQLRMRPGQNQYFYGNRRLRQENARMIEQNRIEEEERRRFQRQFPTMDEITGPVDNTGNPRDYTDNLQQDPFDDDYGVDEMDDDEMSWEGIYRQKFRDQNEEENFNWFIQRNRFSNGNNMSHESLQEMGTCPICCEQFTEILKPKKSEQKESNENGDQMIQEENSQQVFQEKHLIMHLYCHPKHYFHKPCAIMWLKKQLSDTRKAQCPICKKDFRDHEIYAQADPDFRSRFILLPAIQDEGEDSFIADDEDEDSRQQYERVMQPRRRQMIDLRMQHVIDRNQRRAREQERNRGRRNRLTGPVRRQEEANLSDSQSESRLYPRDSESEIQVVQSVSNEEVDEQTPVNPEKDKQYWKEYFDEKEPESNPFLQTQQDEQSQISSNPQK